MSDVKWTPGPWEAESFSNGAFNICALKHSESWAVLASRSPWGDYRNASIANAHLIAASPSLYERLRVSTRVMEAISESLSDHEREAVLDEIEQNESVLAKARGES